METREANTQRWRFGIFEVDCDRAELRRGGIPVKLREQSFRILVLLLERAGDIVAREELRQRLWPSDTWVDFDHSLNTAVMKLRDALGDSADKPLYIETIPKRGYRFVAPVSHSPISQSSISQSPISQSPFSDNEASRNEAPPMKRPPMNRQRSIATMSRPSRPNRPAALISSRMPPPLSACSLSQSEPSSSSEVMA